MTVLDKVRRRQMEAQTVPSEAGSPQTSQGSSALAVAEPAHIVRLKGTMYMLRSMIEANDDGSGLAKMAFLMTTVSDEIATELAEYDETAIRLFMFQIGEVISWIGHGDNSRLPDPVRPFAEAIQPTIEPQEEDCGCPSGELDTERW